jgi:serine/threonine protein kinase
LAFAPNEPLLNDPAVVGGRGYVVGTMDYIAPEQARHATAVGPAADLYGLGCSLVLALTGKVPFPARTTQEKLARHRTDPPPPLDVPPIFRGVVYRLMAKDPAERPRSAAEARELLLPWATAAHPRSAVDAVALADDPHGDAGLWDAAPGEELPEPEEKPKWELVHDLDDGEAEVLDIPPEDDRPRPRSGCAAAALLFAALAAGAWIL